MGGAFTLARIRGIPIRIHVTFLLVLPFLAYAFGSGLADAARLAGVSPDRIVGSRWAWGLGLALGLFASVLLHEVAHSLHAIRHAGQVRAITLFMIGGVFNLLPAFPMDGGRILRGVLARRLGAVRATRIAARLGRAFAVLFAVLGFLRLDVILLVISFVVYVGAESEYRQVVTRAALGGLRVRDFMSPLDAGAAADEPLLAVAARMVRERRTCYPVTDRDRKSVV